MHKSLEPLYTTSISTRTQVFSLMSPDEISSQDCEGMYKLGLIYISLTLLVLLHFSGLDNLLFYHSFRSIEFCDITKHSSTTFNLTRGLLVITWSN